MKYLSNLWNQLYLPGLLKSKRFWFAIMGVVSVAVSQYQPGMEPYMPQIIEGVVITIVTYIGGQSLIDAVTKGVAAGKDYKPEE